MIRWALGGSWSLAVLAAILTATVCAWLYGRELQFAPQQRIRWLLPILRMVAISLVALTLAQPQLESMWQSEKPGRVAFLLDASESMTLADGETARQDSRFERACVATRDTSGPWRSIFAEAATTVFRSQDDSVTLLRELTPLAVRENENTDALAQPPADGELNSWTPREFSSTSPLGEQLLKVAASLPSNPRERAGIVLLSDGATNAGPSLNETAAKLADLGIAVYPIGFGAIDQQSDLIAANIVVPQSVFRSAQVAGTFVFMDYMDRPAIARLQVRAGESILWSHEITCTGVGQRSVDFSFPAIELHDGVDLGSATVHTAAVTGSIQLQPGSDATEVTLENNEQQFLINVETSISSLLMIDGHSRWETRYLKNLFQRDPTWEIMAKIVGNRPTEPPLSSPNELNDVDLIIIGDVPHESLRADQQQWLADFVAQGGGLIVIDGPAMHLHAPEYEILQRLLPVDLVSGDNASNSASKLDRHTELEPAGVSIPALNLVEATSPLEQTDATDSNAAFWQTLPELQFVASSRAKLESEVLARLASPVDSTPLFATWRFGAGRVLYAASDQTWRWRYKSADAIHGRLWNQLARWVARKRSRVQNDFLSLDSSMAFAQEGTPVELSCELADTAPASGLEDVIAKISDATGKVIRRVRLPKSGPAQFRSMVNDLPTGELTVVVEAEGYSAESLDIRLPLLITPQPSVEMQVVPCSQAQLEELARMTGGEYLHESNLQQLPKHLIAFRGSNVQSQIFQVWSSYYWFAAAMVLLSIEWLLRKRIGLV